MSVIKSFFIAFSIYSKIPVPQFAWKDEDMRYTLCFFPLVGVVIGLVLFGWAWLCIRLGIGKLAYVLVGTAIPLAISGGFHVDGFMDTMDAFHSYQPREKKLEILKDSHVGAFAVIMLVLYYLIYIAAFSEIQTMPSLKIFCVGFVLSRVLSGLGVVFFPSAKKDGMLHYFADSAQEKVVKIVLSLELLCCVGVMLWFSLTTGILTVAAAFFTFGYYRWRTNRELGGITGDTAGYFVTVCEAVMAIAAAVGIYLQ
jgi:adenosylcobinamide-GDP ribazoletransferase